MDPFGHARKKARSETFLNENGGLFNPHESNIFGDGNRFKAGGMKFALQPEKESNCANSMLSSYSSDRPMNKEVCTFTYCLITL